MNPHEWPSEDAPDRYPAGYERWWREQDRGPFLRPPGFSIATARHQRRPTSALRPEDRIADQADAPDELFQATALNGVAEITGRVSFNFLHDDFSPSVLEDRIPVHRVYNPLPPPPRNPYIQDAYHRRVDQQDGPT